MYLKMTKRMLLETDKRLVWKLVRIMGLGGMRAINKFKRRLKKGVFFPPYLYISIINSCNLRCQGCWVDVAADREMIDMDAMTRMLSEARAMGNRFFGLLGGEPFMHPQLLDIVERFPDCYFQVFTNGQFITDEVAKKMRKLGNVTPLVSIEGNEIISDERRGRGEVFNKTMRGLQNCLDNKLLTGVCTSLCQSNYQDLLSEEWLDRLIEMGVLYAWYHVYRPVGPDACPDLALDEQQQRYARKFVVEMRAKKPIVIIDAYYDGQGQSLCPAATGFTHHISPWGDIEPCPIIQFSTDSIHDERSLADTFNNSTFLRDFRQLAAASSRGCIMLERPDLVKELVEKHDARDSTARGTAMSELEAMIPRPSQDNHQQNNIPEKNWAYRFVKKHWFYDFGAYDTAPVVSLRSQIQPPKTTPPSTAESQPDLVQIETEPTVKPTQPRVP